ncbi:heme ABC transporter ATP-binding protein [Salininema proteolyticum]|uniref:Heme ABC transporter ATP-binding protein n=1 Tax=Salininema proteolyticum TaxID=1607685 RepID=A0ABV8U5U1_9ACTN
MSERYTVTAEDVRYSAGGTRILDGVGLAAEPGEVLTLLGPNGAGKSTLLGVLAGDLDADTGRVAYGGEDLRRWKIARRARLRAVLPQHHRVSFPFAVREVVAMARAPWRESPPENDEAVVARSLEATDVAHLAGRSFPSLSGGEAARVMLARVLAQETPVVYLDEPTAALDLRHQELVGRICRQLAAEGRTVVAVLHDLGLAAAYSDRIALLDAGRVHCAGRPAEVLTAAHVTEVYDQPVTVDLDPGTGATLVRPVRERP